MSRPTAPRRRGDHVLAGIPVAWLVVFFLAPLGFTVVYSFGVSTFGGVRLGFSFDNYRTALSGIYLKTFLATARYAVISCVLCIAAALPVAYFIARRAGRHKTLALAIVLIPYLTSFLVRVMSWQILLARGGAAEHLLNALGLHAGPLDVLDTRTAVYIGTVYAYLPIAIVPIYVVLDRVPAELFEASHDLGGSRLKTFVHVTLPMSRPGIATAVLLTAVPMLGELVIPQLLGGGKGLFMGQAISSQYLKSQNYALGSAMAVLVLAAVTAIVAILARLTKGFDEVGG
ncbi:ABC transporter permease [Spelaeicoccus albus]|uniref:ABC-type spermidine/putrescine transport system permease subunit I n=1 Tax=Spelaeicoccus albus TaxID=1280376 RepID=A0A7Z0CZH3_9MICO|nr:ABC transporter permease [Spelaeicoccus albus]NYI66326.1 ABC-type spermidine/putrescine transport system permease subunit I [Spelaeicoccus albus]